MRITEVECFAFSIPGHPYYGGHAPAENETRGKRYLSHRYYRAIYPSNTESMLVRIVTDEGIEGFGEAQACIVPEVLAILVKELLAPVLIDADPREPAVLRDRLYDLMRERGHDAGFLPDAIAACDIALWDIAARAANLPLYRMLGGAYRSQIPCYISGVPAKTIDEELGQVAHWLERGFHRFKFSYEPTIEAHVEHLAALRREFGGKLEITIDAHWAFDLRQAIDLGKALEPYRIHWLECPLTPENAANQAVMPRQLPMAHALGEEYRTRYHFLDRLSRGAIDIAQPDIGRVGITEGRRIVALCSAFNTPVAFHLGAGLGIYTAATLHMAAAAPGLDVLEYQPTQLAISDNYYAPSLQPADGAYPLPPGPGLGVVPQLEKLRPLAIC
ncbi:MAG TPA: mandelate racemase/muconate lactonizing enzyme family protein [Chthoniobacteraceae bacterium]|nr:mandelate racemase/muconate lactonizing enzyme family protein [Chthoniobacteraceae bacterium]